MHGTAAGKHSFRPSAGQPLLKAGCKSAKNLAHRFLPKVGSPPRTNFAVTLLLLRDRGVPAAIRILLPLFLPFRFFLLSLSAWFLVRSISHVPSRVPTLFRFDSPNRAAILILICSAVRDSVISRVSVSRRVQHRVVHPASYQRPP